MTALLLQGCQTIGPGYEMTARQLPVRDPTLRADGRPVDDRPPEGAVTPITPDLVRQLRAALPRAVTPDVQSLLGKPEDYRLGPGDVLGIVVYDHPELVFSTIPATTVADPASVSPAPGFIVSNTGQLSFPYAGTLKVEGMTVQQLEDTLTTRLARVYREPQLSVRVQAFRSKRVYVEGEVRAPGLQVVTDIPMTLPEAINRAGGIAPTGDRSSVLLTRNGKTVPIDLIGLSDAGIDPTRIPLRNGDLVLVRNRDESKISVMGEVLLPSAILMRNGRLTLNDALSEAGGVNLGSANPRQIYVIRNEVPGKPTVFHMDARDPTALALAEAFPLKAKDVVYVDPVALVAWTRLVNLILPSSSTINSIRDIQTPRR